MRRSSQAGFSLIELIIAITLVAAISAGLLSAMRNGLLTMQRTQTRLEEARRAMGIQALLRREIGGAMPVRGLCDRGGATALTPIFRGNDAAMLLVTTESSTEGARGNPRILFYQVAPNPDATVRLEMVELPFSGPWSTAPACDPALTVVNPPRTETKPVVLYPRLASCRFRYRNLNFDTLLPRDPWLDVWVFPYLPYAIQVEMTPVPDEAGSMPVGIVTVPLHLSRLVGEPYADE
ncbi:MAG: hypothetical protein RL328_2238 [Acidobacteriota bacterium]|jgi:prepilin-type N-terminal cleavage/methylation domain-containing protein